MVHTAPLEEGTASPAKTDLTSAPTSCGETAASARLRAATGGGFRRLGFPLALWPRAASLACAALFRGLVVR